MLSAKGVHRILVLVAILSPGVLAFELLISGQAYHQQPLLQEAGLPLLSGIYGASDALMLGVPEGGFGHVMAPALTGIAPVPDPMLSKQPAPAVLHVSVQTRQQESSISFEPLPITIYEVATEEDMHAGTAVQDGKGTGAIPDGVWPERIILEKADERTPSSLFWVEDEYGDDEYSESHLYVVPSVHDGRHLFWSLPGERALYESEEGEEYFVCDRKKCHRLEELEMEVNSRMHYVKMLEAFIQALADAEDAGGYQLVMTNGSEGTETKPVTRQQSRANKEAQKGQPAAKENGESDLQERAGKAASQEQDSNPSEDQQSKTAEQPPSGKEGKKKSIPQLYGKSLKIPETPPSWSFAESRATSMGIPKVFYHSPYSRVQTRILFQEQQLEDVFEDMDPQSIKTVKDWEEKIEEREEGAKEKFQEDFALYIKHLQWLRQHKEELAQLTHEQAVEMLISENLPLAMWLKAIATREKEMVAIELQSRNQSNDITIRIWVSRLDLAYSQIVASGKVPSAAGFHWRRVDIEVVASGQPSEKANLRQWINYYRSGWLLQIERQKQKHELEEQAEFVKQREKEWLLEKNRELEEKLAMSEQTGRELQRVMELYKETLVANGLDPAIILDKTFSAEDSEGGADGESPSPPKKPRLSGKKKQKKNAAAFRRKPKGGNKKAGKAGPSSK